ncbi:MAG: methyltransferase domain-containing protein [Cyanobacteriota bacterium]
MGENISTRHQALVEQLKRMGLIRTPVVEAAFRAVPRHLFLPDVPVEKVYQDEAIVTKRLDGQPVSSSSQPAVMAIMLEQLDLKPGHRVLEIGAGTGYNAALIAHIVGDTGQVITVDLDEDIAENARNHLATAGFDRVQVVCTDGGFGYADAAPYDRIILTVGAWDIAPAWSEQLKPNGRLLLPLKIKEDVQLTVAFELADSYLVSISTSNCGFIKLRGAFAEPQDLKNRPKSVIEHFKTLLTQLGWFLPLPFQLKLKLYNQMTFGHPFLESLRIRAYPQETNYIPSANEFAIVKRWTYLVLDWQ